MKMWITAPQAACNGEGKIYVNNNFVIARTASEARQDEAIQNKKTKPFLSSSNSVITRSVTTK
jgi:hypothetical protein